MSISAKILISLGVAFILGGVLWQLAAMMGLSLGKLPGDIVINRPGAKFYFPVMTCVLISILFSLVGWLIRWFQNRQ
jgi:hypothetical protein